MHFFLSISVKGSVESQCIHTEIKLRVVKSVSMCVQSDRFIMTSFVV